MKRSFTKLVGLLLLLVAIPIAYQNCGMATSHFEAASQESVSNAEGFSWFGSDAGTCSKFCGSGLLNRSIVCKDPQGNVASDDKCVGLSRPPSQIACGRPLTDPCAGGGLRSCNAQGSSYGSCIVNATPTPIPTPVPTPRPTPGPTPFMMPTPLPLPNPTPNPTPPGTILLCRQQAAPTKDTTCYNDPSAGVRVVDVLRSTTSAGCEQFCKNNSAATCATFVKPTSTYADTVTGYCECYNAKYSIPTSSPGVDGSLVFFSLPICR